MTEHRTQERPPCRAGADHGPWFRGEGFWNAVGLGFVSPLISLTLYAFAIAAASWWTNGPMALRLAIGLLPLWVLLGVLAVQAREGHRGWCLFGRSVLITCVVPAWLVIGMFAA